MTKPHLSSNRFFRLCLIPGLACLLLYQLGKYTGFLVPLSTQQQAELVVKQREAEFFHNSIVADAKLKVKLQPKSQQQSQQATIGQVQQVRIPPQLFQNPTSNGQQGKVVANTNADGQPIIIHKSDGIYQRGTWDKSPIVIEKYKLVFFTVPKVGCTVFKQLFRRMMGHANWKAHQYYSEPFLPHNPATNGLKYLGDYPLQQANDMLTSPDWTRAIFIRQPEERVLSAYLDKSAYSKGYYLRMRCCNNAARNLPKWGLLQCENGTKQYTLPAPGETNTPILSFEDFLKEVIPGCSDPHWEPQAIRMGPQYWERINFIGRFENVHEDTKQLLMQIGAWEEYGAKGWGDDNGEDGAIFDPNQKAKHGTKAQDKASKSEYLTPEALGVINSYYDMDYKHSLLKFERPQ